MSTPGQRIQYACQFKNRNEFCDVLLFVSRLTSFERVLYYKDKLGGTFNDYELPKGGLKKLTFFKKLYIWKIVGQIKSQMNLINILLN